MKPADLFIIFLCTVSVSIQAQPTEFIKTSAVGVHISFFDFTGADSLSAFGKYAKTGLSLNFQNTITEHWSYSVTVAGSFPDFNDKKNRSSSGAKQLLLEADGSLQRKLLSSNNRFQPYVQAGIGISNYNRYYGIFIPAGLGCQVSVTRDVFLLINSQYRLPVTNTQSQHFYHSIGIAGTINRKKIIKVQPATVQQPPVKVPAPIDTDGDGIVDTADACPQIIGVIGYHGCPVPDRDADGINDDMDLCPDIKGVAEHKGCPIPDKDQDGVEDGMDKCPDLAGSATNEGCPEIKEDVNARINRAATQIFFQTGSYRLLPKSYVPLNEVIQLLKENPSLQLTIEGHTDNTGTLSANQLLSENRARTVLQYLLKGGIDEKRLKAIGYGQAKPITENATPEGRTKNRRVELKPA